MIYMYRHLQTDMAYLSIGDSPQAQTYGSPKHSLDVQDFYEQAGDILIAREHNFDPRSGLMFWIQTVVAHDQW